MCMKNGRKTSSRSNGAGTATGEKFYESTTKSPRLIRPTTGDVEPGRVDERYTGGLPVYAQRRGRSHEEGMNKTCKKKGKISFTQLMDIYKGRRNQSPFR